MTNEKDTPEQRIARLELPALETTIADITVQLRQRKFPNEQAISQGIVLRLLRVLGWDPWDTATVWPEYQTGEGRPDFALCHPPTKPAIFIEVKQPGKVEDAAVHQALQYAFQTGVPFIVLTDGATWSFYLPAEQGSYEKRRVYRLDLLERPPVEAAEALCRYLAHDRVVAGEALEIARQEYRSLFRRDQARAAIPEVWRELVDKGNEELVELLAGKVEPKTGIRPDADDVAEFLSGLGKPVIVETSRSNTSEHTERPISQWPAKETSAAASSSCGARSTPTSTPRKQW